MVFETQHIKTAAACTIGLLVAVGSAHAELIVDLDPATARFDSLTDDDSGSGGFVAGDPGGQNANGLTFNVTFTPAAGDLDSTTAAVNLVEVGGDANGSGLYLLGGEVVFISKMNGGAGDVPNAFDDLDFSSGNDMIGAKSSFGTLTAGTTYTVAAQFDPITNANLRLAVKPDGGSVTLDSFSITGVGGKTNWSGDDSASALRGGNIGNFGGGNTVGGDPFNETLINNNPFEGTAGQALYWSERATVIPEPASLALVALGGLLVNRRRREQH